jgi:hypothetical protein
MSILIVGGLGNMGLRYAAILKHLARDFTVVDKKHTAKEIRSAAIDSTGVIIATPTKTHCPMIRLLSDINKPILCEKPLSKDIGELKLTLAQCVTDKTNLTMVMQYKMLLSNHHNSAAPSSYNYFKHGADGLIWDCTQIIGLAKGPVEIKEDSPFWHCKINGKTLDIGEMDWAYIQFIKNWLQYPGDNLHDLLRIHQKVAEMAEGSALVSN